MTTLALILLAIVIVFGTMLLQYVMRENRLDSVRVVGESKRALDPSNPQFIETFQLLTRTTIYPGNQVELLLNGEIFERLLEDLREAKSVITWHVFWFYAGKVAGEIAEVLVDRARAGVKIFFLLDPFGSKIDKKYLQQLMDAGIEVHSFRKPGWKNLYKVQQRMHIRSVVIDGHIGYTGGFGIDDRWNGNGREAEQWRDTNVRVVGPAVDQLQASFVTNWAETTHHLLLGDILFHPEDKEVGDIRCGVMHTAPSLGSTNGERYYVLSIVAAQSRLYITNPYFIPDRDFRRLLCEAAERGIDVRVLNPGRNTDKMSVFHASRHDYEQMLECGVRIYEYRPTMIHAKTLVCDGAWFSVGTINFDNRSITLNDEVTLAGRDERLSQRLEEIFLEDLEFADEIELEEFRKRPRSEKLKEWLWSRVELVL